jgi:hypothetical protein
VFRSADVSLFVESARSVGSRTRSRSLAEAVLSGGSVSEQVVWLAWLLERWMNATQPISSTIEHPNAQLAIPNTTGKQTGMFSAQPFSIRVVGSSIQPALTTCRKNPSINNESHLGERRFKGFWEAVGEADPDAWDFGCLGFVWGFHLGQKAIWGGRYLGRPQRSAPLSLETERAKSVPVLRDAARLARVLEWVPWCASNCVDPATLDLIREAEARWRRDAALRFPAADRSKATSS